MFLDISRRLLYYKRKDIQKAIVEASEDREVGIKYGQNGFGKRPDVLIYENDVLSVITKGATSFHVSEERWNNPLDLQTSMKKPDMDELRKGWDLVLDIDCPFWEYSKLTAHLFIKALKHQGIKSISCKFSGNKGFHIGVPFEAFPDEINGMPIKDWFPEGPKRIALYLLDYIAENLISVKGDSIDFDGVKKTTVQELINLTGKTEEDLSKTICPDCRNTIKENTSKKKIEFICPKCEKRIVKEEETPYLFCPSCKSPMNKFEYADKTCKICGSSKEPKQVFDPLSIVDIDTILISSRHMYRSPYSLHEKSGLASIPFDPNQVLEFEKEMARPQTAKISNSHKFLDTSDTSKDEAKTLLLSAFDYGKEDIRYKEVYSEKKESSKEREFEEVSEAIPVELFPPCILKILEGIDDGKKRSLFVLTNFLTSVGWSYDEVEEALIEWNKKNKEPLKEQLIRGQVSYHKRRKEKVLPPNCRSYYQDFGMCFPDSLCDKIKNPVQYSKRKAFIMNKPKSRSVRLTEEQKEMRRKHRQKLKKEKEMKHR